MVTNAADYEWVQGITNGEVVIDGGIMPARDTAYDPQGIMQPRCLRGEDICFLAECAGQRNTVMQQAAQTPHAYSRAVSHNQIAAIQSNLVRNIHAPQSLTDNCYICPGYQFTTTHTDIHDYVWPWTLDQHSPLTILYPDCAISSYVSHDPGQ